MSFEARIAAFAERFLSDRTCQLIIAPALADLQFEEDTASLRRVPARMAVLRALAGGVRHDVSRGCGGFALLTLVPACYYLFMLVMLFDVVSVSISKAFLFFALLIVILSFGPVTACFWPARDSVRSTD